MSDQPHAGAPQMIERDVTCQGCGYNLRGLAPDGRCPECGGSVADSIRPDLLEFANPNWLAKVKLGADMLYYGIIIGIFGGMVVGCLGIVAGARVIPIGMLPLLMMGFQAVSSIFHVFAIFLLTTQEPRLSLIESQLTWRSFIRVAVIAGVGVQALNIVAQTTGWTAFLWIAVCIGLITGPVVMYAEFSYAASFARRIPDDRLVKQTGIVKWALSFLTFMFGALGLLIMLTAPTFLPMAIPATGPIATTTPAPAPARPNPVFMWITGIATPCTGVVYLVFAVWGLILLWRYRRAFRELLAKTRSRVLLAEPLP